MFVSNDPEYQTEEQEGDADLAELDVAEEEIDYIAVTYNA